MKHSVTKGLLRESCERWIEVVLTLNQTCPPHQPETERKRGFIRRMGSRATVGFRLIEIELIETQPGIWAGDRSLLPSSHERDAKSDLFC
jgi:hypothetical protein